MPASLKHSPSTAIPHCRSTPPPDNEDDDVYERCKKQPRGALANVADVVQSFSMLPEESTRYELYGDKPQEEGEETAQHVEHVGELAQAAQELVCQAADPAPLPDCNGHDGTSDCPAVMDSMSG